MMLRMSRVIRPDIVNAGKCNITDALKPVPTLVGQAVK